MKITSSTHSPKHEYLTSALKHIILVIILVIMLYPFVWMISASLMTSKEITSRPLTWLPAVPQFINYVNLQKAISLGRVYFNSSFVTIVNTISILFTSSLAGYAFSKLRFPGRDALFLLTVSSMMIPFFVILIPVYYIISQLDLVDTYIALILPNIISAFGIFLMRQYMTSIPTELIDAARMDGASEFAIYWRVIVPLSGPAFGALAILIFVYQWNQFLWPLIAIHDPDMWTLPIAINSLRIHETGRGGTSPELANLQLAGAALAIIPVLILVALLQKYFVEGIALTGLKE